MKKLLLEQLEGRCPAATLTLTIYPTDGSGSQVAWTDTLVSDAGFTQANKDAYDAALSALQDWEQYLSSEYTALTQWSFYQSSDDFFAGYFADGFRITGRSYDGDTSCEVGQLASAVSTMAGTDTVFADNALSWWAQPMTQAEVYNPTSAVDLNSATQDVLAQYGVVGPIKNRLAIIRADVAGSNEVTGAFYFYYYKAEVYQMLRTLNECNARLSDIRLHFGDAPFVAASQLLGGH